MRQHLTYLLFVALLCLPIITVNAQVDTNATLIDTGELEVISIPKEVKSAFPETDLINTWRFEGAYDAQSDTLITDGIFSDFISLYYDTIFNADLSIESIDKLFKLKIESEGLELDGSWKQLGNELYLRPYVPSEASIDEVNYQLNTADTVMRLYNNGRLVMALKKDGLHFEQELFVYQLEVSANDKLTLTTANKQYRFEYLKPQTTVSSVPVNIGRGIIGIAFLLFIAWLFSSNRKAIDWPLVFKGLILQIAFAILVLKVPAVRFVFEWVSGFFVQVLNFTREGSIFLFGGIVSNVDTYGFIFAFQVLPTIVFFSALSSLLYYLGILQKVVYVFAWVMNRFMKMSGAESLAAAANIFIGQTEAPLVVKPYLEKMTKSEILCLMVGGMATIAGGVFAAYVGFLGGTDPEMQQMFATHLLSASIMSAPAAIIAAKMLFPEENPEAASRELKISKDKIGSNILDAISHGTSDGLKLAINVGAMLLVFTALIAMVNFFFTDMLGKWTGLNAIIAEATDGRYTSLSLQYILGMALAPLAWILGVPNYDIVAVGQLLGEKTILNEFYAYASLGTLKDAGILANQKSILIATYALCGFANFASIGIQIGGIGAIAPSQRSVLARFGIKALIGGTIACFLTAAIAGILV